MNQASLEKHSPQQQITVQGFWSERMRCVQEEQIRIPSFRILVYVHIFSQKTGQNPMVLLLLVTKLGSEREREGVIT